MDTNTTRLAARALRLVPRKRLSRTLGRLALLRGPRSVVRAAIAAYVHAYDVDMTEVDVPPDGFRTFDEFFTRRLRPGTREIDPDPRALSCPADGRLEGMGRISMGADLLVKHTRYSARSLLGSEQAASVYRGGRFFVVYLSPKDYHRVHAPTEGAVRSVRYIPGTLFPVNSIGSEHVPQLLARNERVVVVQSGKTHGQVATILVGALGVGRIGLAFDSLQTNRGDAPGERTYGDAPLPLDRGAELGVFHQGSTVVVMTAPECQLETELSVGTQLRVGEALGRGTSVGELRR